MLIIGARLASSMLFFSLSISLFLALKSTRALQKTIMSSSCIFINFRPCSFDYHLFCFRCFLILDLFSISFLRISFNLIFIYNFVLILLIDFFCVLTFPSFILFSIYLSSFYCIYFLSKFNFCSFDCCFLIFFFLILSLKILFYFLFNLDLRSFNYYIFIIILI